MSTRSRQYIPFDPDPTDRLDLDWILRQLYRLSNIVSDLTDGTGSKLKYIKIVNGTDTFPYTVNTNEHVVLVDPNGSNVVLNLPAGVDQKRFHITNISTTGNTVTVTPNGTEQINRKGSGTGWVLNADSAISPIYVATDSTWYVL